MVRLSQLELEEVAAAQRAHKLAVRYEADVASAGYVQDEAAVARESVRAIEVSFGRTQSLLRQEALVAYVGGVPAAAGSDAGAGEYLSQADRTTYERVAVGDLSGTLTAFRLEQRGLSRAIGTYERDLARDLQAEREVGASRRGALVQASSLEAMILRTRSGLAAEAAKHQASAGPPVGNGVVKAVATSMGLSAETAAYPSSGRGARPAALDATTAATTTSAAATTTSKQRAATTTTVPTTTTTTTTAPVTSASTSTGAQAPSTPAGSATSASSVAAAGRPPTGGVWLELRYCESGDDYQANTGNGFYGAYQFAWSTWTGLGFPGRPDQEPYWMQDEAAQRLQALQGWGPWPACSAALGL